MKKENKKEEDKVEDNEKLKEEVREDPSKEEGEESEVKVEESEVKEKEEVKEVKSKDDVKEVKSKEKREDRKEEVKEKPSEDLEKEEKKVERGPKRKIKELRGVLHVYSSKNNTIVHATDITGAETISIKTGGQMVKSQREESSPYAAMQATKEVIRELEDKGISRIHVKIRAPGGYNGPYWTGKGAQAVIKALSRSNIRIDGMENTTPVPHGRGCRPKGGKRGRRV